MKLTKVYYNTIDEMKEEVDLYDRGKIVFQSFLVFLTRIGTLNTENGQIVWESYLDNVIRLKDDYAKRREIENGR